MHGWTELQKLCRVGRSYKNYAGLDGATKTMQGRTKLQKLCRVGRGQSYVHIVIIFTNIDSRLYLLSDDQ